MYPEKQSYWEIEIEDWWWWQPQVVAEQVLGRRIDQM